MKLRLFLSIGVLLFNVLSIRADEITDRLEALEKRIAELELKLKEKSEALDAQVAKSLSEISAQVKSVTEERQPAGNFPNNNFYDKLHIGGYGELHFNYLKGRGGAPDKEEIDFHRFVLLLGYDFTDRIRFRSELEVEHVLSGEGKSGEVELEQAYFDFDLNDKHTLRAGLFLMPVGLINQVHEPPYFYGVERPVVENAILPTTWWEAGAGLHGDLGAGFKYQVYIHSGLSTTSNKLYAVRSGRRQVSNAPASDPAATLALNWSRPGITLGGSVQYQADITQSKDSSADDAWLGELHADLKYRGFGLRALYAEWHLDGGGPAAIGADKQYGWYVEPSYRISEKVGVFARYSEWDNLAGDSVSKSRKRQYDVGLNVWPIEQLVLKADYIWQDNEDDKNQRGVNLGMGYVF